jgi:hypothetical protein
VKLVILGNTVGIEEEKLAGILGFIHRVFLRHGAKTQLNYLNPILPWCSYEVDAAIRAKRARWIASPTAIMAIGD